MLTRCIADAERDVGMKNLSQKEAITILEGMRIDIPLPKAAVTQMKRNLALDMAINALNCSEIPNNSDTISRQQAIDALKNRWKKTRNYEGIGDDIAEECELYLKQLPSAEPKRKKMSNKEWVDFLSEQFTVSRTSAREMLHGLMRWKAEDNFKKQFSGGKNESRRM